MDDIEYKRKYSSIAVLTLLVGTASVFLPWFDLRPNRVAEAIPVRLISMPALATAVIILLVLSAAVQLGLRKVPHNRIMKFALRLQALIAPLALWLAMYLAAGSSPVLEQSAGRIGIGGGAVLYILALALPLIPGDRVFGSRVLFAISVVGGMMLVLPLAARMGIVMEAYNQRRRLISELVWHLRITLVSVSISTVIGLFLAILSWQWRAWERRIIPLLNILQTVPSIALFGLLIAPLSLLSNSIPLLREMGLRGIGNAPAIIALSIYGMYPVIRNALAGLSLIDPALIDAGKGMGMTSRQIWTQVRLPLAAPVMLHGIRINFIQTLGNTTLAKLIGGNGLGVFVFEGLGQASSDMVLLGMGLIILLTLAADWLIQLGIVAATPRGIQAYSQKQAGATA